MNVLARKEKRSRREPSETAQLSENVICQLWISSDNRVNWKLLRVNPKDSSRPYTTFTPRHLPELVKAHATLASVFANAPVLSADQRSNLEELSKLLESVAEILKEHDQPEMENGKDESRVLAFPSR